MQVDIRDTFGADFIGGMVAAIMYGITTLQTYLYFVYYPRDSKGLKFLVALIWVLDTLHVTLMCHALYHYLVASFGDENAIQSSIWSLNGSLAPNLGIIIIVQSYFTSRIFRLSRPSIRWWLTSSIMVTIVAHFAFGVETISLMFIKTEFSELPQITLNAFMPLCVVNVLSDVFIAITLCVLLYGSRSQITETNVLLNTLIVYAINRCLLSSVVSIAELLTFAVLPNTMWFMAIDFVIGKLYANSFLASLNSRSSLRERGFHSHQNSRVDAIDLSVLRNSREGDNGGAIRNKPSSVFDGAPRNLVKEIQRDDDEMDDLGKADV